jgi:host factor-I protein
MLKLSKGFDAWGETIRNDKYSVILETNQQERLIFKHAISTVVVSKPFHGPMHTNAPSAASHSVPGAPVGNGDN